MTISNETVEPATARFPTFSGRVTLMRYQLKLTLPLPRASSVAGSITGHRESSKPAVACMGGVIVGPHGSSRGLKVWPKAFRIDVHDVYVVVTPFRLYNLRSFPGAEINRCVWTPVGRGLSGPVLSRQRLDPKK